MGNCKRTAPETLAPINYRKSVSCPGTNCYSLTKRLQCLHCPGTLKLAVLFLRDGIIQVETGISLCPLEKQFGFMAGILYK